MAGLLALAALGAFMAIRGQAPRETGVRDMASAGGPSPLWAGVRYLFVVRLEVSDDMARAILESKAVEALELAPASEPPFWAKPGEPFSDRVAAFRFLARGNGSVTLGSNFYEVGRLEKVVRLDGQPFSSPAPADVQSAEGWS